MSPHFLSSNRSVLVSLIVLGTVFLGLELSSIDLYVQDFFYVFDTGRWIVDRGDPLPRLLFYTGIKIPLIICGITSLLLFVGSFWSKKIQAYRFQFLYVFLCMGLIPSVIASMKYFSSIHCPWDVVRYGGIHPYVKLLNMDVEILSMGKCFPGGHASGGFALFAFCFLSERLRYIVAAFSATMIYGWTMGLYQMMKGAHYLNHIIATMFLAWILSTLLHRLMVSVSAKRKI